MSARLNSSRTLSISREIRRTPARYLCCVLAVFVLLVICSLSYSTALAASQPEATGGDPKRGEELFQRRCASCHSLDKEKEGPRLRGVFGRKAGTVPTFKYSDALKASNITWNADLLNQWLIDTDRFIPDNDMNMSFRNADERTDIIAYLRQLSNQ